MTKARDLAGFSTGSITNTTADGLILKGDGSSTDVVIKNGADATVASVADGTVNIAAAGSITATGASVGALARGAIQVGNSSGVSAPLTKGTSGHVLTAGANDLSWAEAGSGGTAFISSTDISNAATFAFTGFDASKYDIYKLFFSNLTAVTDNANFRMVSSSNGGSSYDTGSGNYTIANLYSQLGYVAAAGSLAPAAGYAYMPITGNMGNASGEEGGASIEITIFGPHLAQYTHFQTRAYYVSNASQPAQQSGGNTRVSAADVDAVRFAFSSGNIASGTFTAYGMVNS